MTPRDNWRNGIKENSCLQIPENYAMKNKEFRKVKGLYHYFQQNSRRIFCHVNVLTKFFYISIIIYDCKFAGANTN